MMAVAAMAATTAVTLNNYRLARGPSDVSEALHANAHTRFSTERVYR